MQGPPAAGSQHRGKGSQLLDTKQCPESRPLVHKAGERLHLPDRCVSWWRRQRWHRGHCPRILCGTCGETCSLTVRASVGSLPRATCAQAAGATMASTSVSCKGGSTVSCWEIGHCFYNMENSQQNHKADVASRGCFSRRFLEPPPSRCAMCGVSGCSGSFLCSFK